MHIPRRYVHLALTNVLALVLVLLSCIFIIKVLFPVPVVVEDSQHGGTVFFAANRQSVLFTRDCVIVQWAVEGIDRVFLGDQPQIGLGKTPACLTNSPPVLRVHFRNGTQQTYQLDITVLSRSPLAISILVTTFALVFLRREQIGTLLTRTAALALTALFLLFYLFFTRLVTLTDIISTADWLTATSATASVITELSLLSLLLLFGAAIGRNHFSPATSPPLSFNRLPTFFAGSFVSILFISATILTVNPRGMYFSTLYSPFELLLRETKTAAYQRLSHKPDIVIMGSSRAFTISPQYIFQQTGLTAYNMAIEGGRIEDFLIQMRQMTDFPVVFLVELQEGLPRQPGDIAARAPLRWIPFMSLDTALLTLEKRLTSLLDIHQFAESIYIANYHSLYNREPSEWPEFDDTGLAVRSPLDASEFQQALLLDIGRIAPEQCDRVDPKSETDIQEMQTVAATHDAALVFYMSPWHPQYVETVFHDNADYQTCYSATVNFMTNLARSRSNVFFMDFSQLKSIDGLDSEFGYYDSQHLTAFNSQRLIDHAVTTLQRAYSTATQDDSL